MNREILFKAKRIDNGGWVEGYYIYHIKRTICPIGDSVKPEDEQHVIMQDGFSDWNMPRDTVVYEIDPDTLCQYTGLTDKNGKKIWENDIIKTSRYGKDDGKGSNFAGFDIFSVQWDDGGFALYSKWRRFNLRDNNGYEVIGNIFDNPELLEVG